MSAVAEFWRSSGIEPIEPAPLRKAAAAIVTVRCPECGSGREITARQRRRVQSAGGNFTCSLCRGTPTPLVEQQYIDYWLKRYSIDWIMDVASGIWGDG